MSHTSARTIMGNGHRDLQACILGRECVAKYHRGRGRGTGWALQGEISAELIYFFFLVFLFSDFLVRDTFHERTCRYVGF